MPTGTVAFFNKRNGFGRIQPEGTEGKKEQIFVHWKQIQTKSKWPCLMEEMEVEYELEEIKGKNQATNVTAPGGDDIDCDDVMDEGKDFGTKKYTGTVQFFHNRKGFGFITPDDEEIEHNDKGVQPADEEDEKKKGGLHFTREDLVVATGDASVSDGAEVKFVLYTKEDQEYCCAGRITMKNGKAIEYTPKTDEEREAEKAAKEAEKSEETEDGDEEKKTTKKRKLKTKANKKNKKAKKN